MVRWKIFWTLSFPDMAVDDDPEIYFNDHEDDNEHVLHGQTIETREKELEASVQGSEYIYSNDEATNMDCPTQFVIGGQLRTSPPSKNRRQGDKRG
jgi:hypothetical protein